MSVVGFIPKCLSCLRDAGSIGFFFLECGHFICEACIHQQHPQSSSSNNGQQQQQHHCIQCQVCHLQCKAISLMDTSHIPKNIYEFVSSKYRNVFNESLIKMEEIIKFQHSHYEHVIRQLKSENQSLKETIQILNNNNQQKKNISSYHNPPVLGIHPPPPELFNQEESSYYEEQKKGLTYHPIEVSTTTPYGQFNRNSMSSQRQSQRIVNGVGVVPSMSPLSARSSSSRLSTHQGKEDLSKRSTLMEKLRSGSPKLPSVSPIRASPNQNLNESLSMIMNQPPSSPSGYSDSRFSHQGGRLPLENIENIDPKTPMKGKSLLPNKTPQQNSAVNRSVLQSRATTPQISKQSPNIIPTKGTLPSLSSRSTSESHNRAETFVENQASDLGLPNRSQLKDKPLLKRKTLPETPHPSSLGIQKQNKTSPINNVTDPTRTPLLSRKLICLSTPSRQRPQSSRGIPPK